MTDDMQKYYDRLVDEGRYEEAANINKLLQEEIGGAFRKESDYAVEDRGVDRAKEEKETGMRGYELYDEAEDDGTQDGEDTFSKRRSSFG